MENKSKKSKAIIITIIAIIILLIVGYFLFKNRANIFGIGSSSDTSKIFSSLETSSNSKKVIAQAGEDLKRGDGLSTSGTNVNNNPIVVKANGNDNIFGFANEGINNGEMGEIILNTSGTNSFWESISGFFENIFTPPEINIPEPVIPEVTIPTIPGYTPQCSDTIDNDNDGTIDRDDPNCLDVNGNYIPTHYTESSSPIVVPQGIGYTPQCSDTIDNDGDGTIDANDSNCHDANGNYVPNHYSESASPVEIPGGGYTPQCSDTIDNDSDGKIDKDDPDCLDKNGNYVPTHYTESTMPIIVPPDFEYKPACSDTKDNDADTFIDKDDPNCHTDGDPSNNDSYVPTHYSESSSPFTPPNGGGGNEGEGTPDLVAGEINPSGAIVNTPIKLSSVITNIGDGNTGASFPGFFAIRKISDSVNGDTIDAGENNAVSKAGFKNTIVKIFNKINLIRKAIAANTTTTGADTLSNVTEVKVTISSLPAGISSVVSTTYTFNSTGTYNIRACADKSSSSDTGTITESNEDNNCGPWTTFTVTNSLPTEGGLPECSDTIDNDNDNKIDFVDPNCHIDGIMGNEYIKDHDDESSSPKGDDADNEETIPPTEENKCLLIENNPLTFTDKEKAELAELLRKFYLIAPTLKTDEDISLVYADIDQYKNFTDQIDGLINECYSEGIDKNGVQNPNFTLFPAKRYGNPWFKSNDRGSATELYTDKDKIYTNFWQELDQYGIDKKAIIDCKLVNGYYSGITKDGKDCGEEFNYTIYNHPWSPSAPDCYYSDPRKDFVDPNPESSDWSDWLDVLNVGEDERSGIIGLGCKWNPGTRFEQVEYLLNIW